MNCELHLYCKNVIIEKILQSQKSSMLLCMSGRLIHKYFIKLPSNIVVETILRKYVRSGALDDFIRTRSLLKKSAASIAVKKAYKEAKHKIRPAILAAKNALLDKIEQEERANIIKSGFTTGAAAESITVSGWNSEIAALEHYLLS